MFHYNGPTCEDKNSTAISVTCPDGLHYWYNNAVETEFQFSSISEVRVIPRACNLTRGTGSFFGVNSFVTPPSQAAAETLNSYTFAKNHIQACSDYNGGIGVNLVQADFWEAGDLPEVVQEHNSILAMNLAGSSGGGRGRERRRRTKRRILQDQDH